MFTPSCQSRMYVATRGPALQLQRAVGEDSPSQVHWGPTIGALLSDGLVDVVGVGHVIHPVARLVFHGQNTHVVDAMVLEEEAET